MLTWKNQTACEEFIVSSNTSYIEVFGDDPSGELLLAVVPLKQLDFSSDEEIEITIEYSDELMFSLFISRHSDNDSEVSVRLQYTNSAKEILEPHRQLNNES